ncbi:UDP-glucose/GDP-mannose dehydrogenase family protein [Rhodovarius crocodyli]|uniref:UDP-glucose 6-dehydrogenase n=1 Tax=Rhodovarius crocodyli TaxID=1979269 RepID=A0A437MFG0_9PROT|nr:UDP-glucose/GDP-mannose dehydrogenase family protein [Rhodovarius crocodyli]RVT96388.1 UDP-glucose/GDP-mannose dehydrogenase family protein [Rhodovarius crocodyli]
MKIAILGAGYVGLVSGACFAEFGVQVALVDKDASKIAALREGRIPIYEPGLDKLVADNVRDGRLTFPDTLEDAMEGVEAVFLAVGTPSRRGDGHADLTYVFTAAEQVARAATRPLTLVTKSTVPVGTGRRLIELVRPINPDITVASNPEFLREGAAIGDFMRPDRVVLGTEDNEHGQRALETLRRLYRPLYLIETPIVATSLETAEIIKYAANSFLAMKISFINEVADLCEAAGADVHDVARGIGLDGRIGRKFLHPGPGYGGSCFPKDTLAFARTAVDLGTPLRLVETTIAVNDARKEDMARRVIAAMGGDVRGKRIAVLGLAFKPETDDIRDAPSLVVLPALAAAGASVVAYDPQSMGFARQAYPASTEFAPSAMAALADADAAVLLTEWNEFRALPPDRLKAVMRGDVFCDFRNVYDRKSMIEAGFKYTSIGRP